MNMSHSTLIKSGTILSADIKNSVTVGDILVKDGKIAGIFAGGTESINDAQVILAKDCIVSPGFIQSHVHLTQTLFRGLAEDLPLIEWLKQKIWPFEYAHDENSIAASARLGIAELLLGGTTAILDMGGMKHTHTIFEVAQEMHFRLTSGKGMSDQGMAPFFESTDASISASNDLADRWHLTQNGLLRYAFAPRFLLSCSKELMLLTIAESRKRGCRLHTHAAENSDECRAVEELFGMGNIEALASLNFVGSDVILAHCVWLNQHELKLLAQSQSNVAHCPSTNMKLASGVADILAMQKAGINVSLGADGPPCNNRLDQFAEMKQCGLLAKLKHGAAAISASDIFKMATINSARALGIDDRVGSIEVGKEADLVIIKPGIHAEPISDPFTALVYSCLPSDVRDVFIRGRRVVENGQLISHEPLTLAQDARRQQIKLLERCS